MFGFLQSKSKIESNEQPTREARPWRQPQLRTNAPQTGQPEDEEKIILEQHASDTSQCSFPSPQPDRGTDRAVPDRIECCCAARNLLL